MPVLLIPEQKTRAEITVSKSRFIATLSPAFSVDEAKAFILEIKKEFSDATHNVPIYMIGHGDSAITHTSDDGEPSGTAGRPALAVLKGANLGDAAVVITRYYGGVKLGTGGLTRAYSDAVREVLKQASFLQKIKTLEIKINIPYGFYENAKKIIQLSGGEIFEEIFEADITLSARFPIEKYPAFEKSLIESSNGRIEPEITQTNKTAHLPYQK